jgi:hypothetical protein
MPCRRIAHEIAHGGPDLKIHIDRWRGSLLTHIAGPMRHHPAHRRRDRVVREACPRADRSRIFPPPRTTLPASTDGGGRRKKYHRPFVQHFSHCRRPRGSLPVLRWCVVNPDEQRRARDGTRLRDLAPLASAATFQRSARPRSAASRDGGGEHAPGGDWTVCRHRCLPGMVDPVTGFGPAPLRDCSSSLRHGHRLLPARKNAFGRAPVDQVHTIFGAADRGGELSQQIEVGLDARGPPKHSEKRKRPRPKAFLYPANSSGVEKHHTISHFLLCPGSRV